jgi:hypothetical protein
MSVDWYYGCVPLLSFLSGDYLEGHVWVNENGVEGGGGGGGEIGRFIMPADEMARYTYLNSVQ